MIDQSKPFDLQAEPKLGSLGISVMDEEESLIFSANWTRSADLLSLLCLTGPRHSLDINKTEKPLKSHKRKPTARSETFG